MNPTLKAHLLSLETWLRGVVAAFISGASTSFLSALGVSGAQAVGITMPSLTFGQMGVIALVGGLVGLAAYLKQSPIPPDPVRFDGKALPLLLACLLPFFLTGCSTPQAGTPKPTIAETVQGAQAWIEANILPGLPGLVAGGVVIAGRELIKDDAQRQEIAGEAYAVAACVRSLMGGALPDSVALRAAIESAGGGGPLLDLTAIADMVGGFVDPYLKQVQGDPNARFAVKFLEAIASGFEKGAALLLKK
jgi:hypothetical protein